LIYDNDDNDGQGYFVAKLVDDDIYNLNDSDIAQIRLAVL